MRSQRRKEAGSAAASGAAFPAEHEVLESGLNILERGSARAEAEEGGSKGGVRASRSRDGRSPGRCRRHETENLLVEILTLIL